MVEKERLFEIAAEAAPYIKGAWRFNRLASEEQSQCWQKRAIISDQNQPGRAIRLGPDWNDKRRVAIAAAQGGPFRGSFYRGHITVSPTRSGRAISGDINRRFLPDFMKAWEEHVICQRNRTENESEFLQKLHLLRKFLPDLRPNSRTDLESDSFYFTTPNNNTGTIKIYKHYSGNEGTIQMSLSIDQLIKVAAFLAACDEAGESL